MPCSGDHTEFEAAVEVAEAKASAAASQAELAHRAALGAMSDASDRDAYISAVKDESMRARLAAYVATLKTAMDRKHDKEEKEKPSAEVAALSARMTELEEENEKLAIAAVTPMVNALAGRTANPKATVQGLGDNGFTPTQIRFLYDAGFARGTAAPVAPDAAPYTAARLVPEAVQAPAPAGMAYSQAPGQPASGQSAPAIAATIPGAGAGQSQTYTAGLVNGEFEVEI